jgi:hypothetical protein
MYCSSTEGRKTYCFKNGKRIIHLNNRVYITFYITNYLTTLKSFCTKISNHRIHSTLIPMSYASLHWAVD